MTFLSQITTISKIYENCLPESQVTIAGWLRTRRDSKKVSFLEINDGSCAHSLQVVVEQTIPDYCKVQDMNLGCSIRIQGKLVLSLGKGQKYELKAESIEILGKCEPETYPLQKKEMSFEYLREIAHLRVRTATFSSIFRIRSQISHCIHKFFAEREFYYVHTPILTTTDGEGAGETFRVTQFHLEQIPKTSDGLVDFSKDFFQQSTMLCVTGQLEAELLIAGLNKVYTFSPTFRAENSNTARHLAEFWMIEPEVAFADINDNMILAEDLIRSVVRHVLDYCQDDLNICFQKTQKNTVEYLKLALEKPFVKLSYTEAIDILLASNKHFEYPVYWGCDLKSEHERYLCEDHFNSPTILFNYPKELKAFYMYLNDDGKTVRAMDVLMPGIGEIIGGSQREDREKLLIERMKEKGISEEHMDWYCSLRRFGSVPHSGFGLGLERLIIWITGMNNIRDVIPFPRTPGNCLF